ncbi:TIR domain-containing protein [Rhodococcus oryzae]|uniref:TIR domain-containing protein n=1 Tax=Rhodococcus oryzae TaxID=2571143 RepID=UPI0037A1E975
MDLPRLFIGSSAEGRAVAHNLQAVLESREVCEVEVWDQGVFTPGGYTLDSLLEVADRSDYAVLVASPDDVTTSRGDTSVSMRDNIILEFGLFLGVLGRDRTYLLTTGPVKLPTDVLGVTRLSYTARLDGNLNAAVNAAALQVAGQVQRHGRRAGGRSPVSASAEADDDARCLEQELDLLCANAVAQGWTVKTNSATTLRLVPPNRRNAAHTLSKRNSHDTREELRKFVAALRADGLRVNNALRVAPDKSPF